MQIKLNENDDEKTKHEASRAFPLRSRITDGKKKFAFVITSEISKAYKQAIYRPDRVHKPDEKQNPNAIVVLERGKAFVSMYTVASPIARPLHAN